MRKISLLGKSFCALLVIALLTAGVCIYLAQWNNQQPEMSVTPNNIYSDTLIIAADINYQPYSFTCKNGNPTGYDIELIYHVANAMHKNVEIRMMQWNDAQQAVRSGEADILMGLDYNLEALNDYELSMPLDNDPFVAFGKTDLTSIEDLYDKKIATLDGSGSFAAFLNPYLLTENVRTYASYSEAFESVANGENDYAIAMYSVGRRAIANLNDSSFHAVGPILAGNYLCIGTKKGNTALAGELNSAIIQLKREGVIDELGNKWLGRYVEVISLQDFIEKNLTTLILILAVLVLSVASVYIIVSRRLSKSAAMQHEMTKKVLEYQQLITEATKGLYEHIDEFDITHNCAGGESTRQYFESLGIPGNTPLDQALKTIAEKQIKPEYIQGYCDTFLPEHVLKSYKCGIDRLSYDFLTSHDGSSYYWMRITARVFYWMEDASVRMIIFRQNIDAEKRREEALEEKVRVDALTGLYNKVATEELVRAELGRHTEREYAFIMLDIDNFKDVNDSLGHAFGDFVIAEFSRELKKQSDAEIAGRIGGDEFAVFLPVKDREWLEQTAASIVRSLCREISIDAKSCTVTTSMGIALFPRDGISFGQLYRKADKALYQTKRRGKNGFTIYDDTGC